MTDKNRMRIYRIEDCVVFKKTKERFGGLSNMAPGFPLVVNGVQIRTSEALYQACRYPHMPEIQRLIVNERSPMTAKMRSRPYRKKSRPDWDQIRVSIMRWCLRVKLAQNWTRFSDLLLQTGNRPIVEESKKDDFWGAKPAENGELIGQNVLGRLLMELREELLGPEIESLKNVVPPKISHFTLFNEPIQSHGNIDQIVVADNVQIALPSDSIPEKTIDKNIKINNMIPKECKRLAEVDFPIAVVSKHSAREKSIRHGHPSTLHLWWARRPLAACRAMLMALLLPDPCDPACPAEFIDQAREILLKKHGRPSRWTQETVTLEGLRTILLEFIGDLANWDNAANLDYLCVARDLVKAAHPGETPLVVDPFSGGGSIPIEALRLGCEAFASDLNPVACLILKVMLEDIPRSGQNMADEVLKLGSKINQLMEEELSKYYPKDLDGAKPLAYFWARTARCEAPSCGVEIPLVRSFWLCSSKKRKVAMRYNIYHPKDSSPKLIFEVFEPRSAKEVPDGVIHQAKATCPVCKAILTKERLRAQLSRYNGGTDPLISEEGNRESGAIMLAKIVRLSNGKTIYRSANKQDYLAVQKAGSKIKSNFIPVERIEQERVAKNSPYRLHLYGMHRFADIPSIRQKLAIQVLVETIERVVPSDLQKLFGCVLSRCVDYWSSCAVWAKNGEFVAHTFGRQALSIVWDYAEAVPIADSSGNFFGAVDWVARVVRALSVVKTAGMVSQLDACISTLPSEAADIWFTDPPYYDAVSYAALSDYFLVWLKKLKSIQSILTDPFNKANQLSPKEQEAIQDEFKVYNGQAKTREYYESKMSDAFREGVRVSKDDSLGCVVFAHKTTEGWEALLSGMISGGWTITGSWPIATERPGRLRSQDSAALATSVHLICRKRIDNKVGDWREVLMELPTRVGNWMERLQHEGIRGADLVFACIGPALEIFSRYSKVETAEGREIKLAEYLEKVWEVVGRTALEQILGTEEARARNGMAGVLEEDARLTALFLWTLQATNGQNGSSSNTKQDKDSEEGDEDHKSKGKAKGYSLVFDVVRRFAQPLGIELPKWESRVIETKKGLVRLMAVSERAKQLFGTDGVETATDWIEENPGKPVQLGLFPDGSQNDGFKIKGRKRSTIKGNIPTEISTQVGATTLDRVHSAMLLQASGQANALRILIKSEQDRSPDFLRLANALSALYPKGTEEKRLLDAMLLAVPR